MIVKKFQGETEKDAILKAQEELGNNTFVLVIDSFDLSRGKLNIKAFRLTRAFMNLFRDKKININEYEFIFSLN